MKNQEQRLYLVYSLNATIDEPVTIHPGKPLYFSEKDKAEDVILKFKDLYAYLYDASLQDERVYCLILEEYELDSPYRYQLSTRVYSPYGLLLSDSIVPDDGPFLGRAKKAIHHKVGEVVELPYGDHLIFGIVVQQPLSFNENAKVYGLTASDDCYAVIHHHSLEMCYAYAPLVFKPSREVTEKVREELLTAFQQVKMNEDQ